MAEDSSSPSASSSGAPEVKKAAFQSKASFGSKPKSQFPNYRIRRRSCIARSTGLPTADASENPVERPSNRSTTVPVIPVSELPSSPDRSQSSSSNNNELIRTNSTDSISSGGNPGPSGRGNDDAHDSALLPSATQSEDEPVSVSSEHLTTCVPLPSSSDADVYQKPEDSGSGELSADEFPPQPAPTKKANWRQSTSTAAPAETTGSSEASAVTSPDSKSPNGDQDAHDDDADVASEIDAGSSKASRAATPSRSGEPRHHRVPLAQPLPRRTRRSLPANFAVPTVPAMPSFSQDPVPTTCASDERPRSALLLPPPPLLPPAIHAPTANRQRHTLPSSALRRSSLPPSQTRCVYPNELLLQMTREARRFTPTNYLERFKTVKGGERVNAESRRLILHYMLDVTHNIANPVSQFSAHMAASLFDRYLSQAAEANDEPLLALVAAEVEVVGAACLYIASKLEDTWSLCLSDVCRTFDGGSSSREKAVLRWELRISSDFAFEFNAPTAVDFMHPMLSKTQDAFGPLPPAMRELAFLAADEALLCAGCLGTPAHVIAAAALLIAITEVHCKAHRTSNLPCDVRELLGGDRKLLCATTGVLFCSLTSHPAYRAFKRRQQQQQTDRASSAASSGSSSSPLSEERQLTLSQESSFSLSSPR